MRNACEMGVLTRWPKCWLFGSRPVFVIPTAPCTLVAIEGGDTNPKESPVDYRGMILRMSPSDEDGRCNDYVCTAHYSGHVEIVPTVPGTETKFFAPICLQGPGTTASSTIRGMTPV